MAGQRPDFIDLRAPSQASVSRPLRSPRLHVAGEAPPEFSPLDAFAMQSRALARQLQEESKAGKRMSRLPPLTTDSPLIKQGRSDYFRSMATESGSEAGESPIPHSGSSGGLGLHADIETVSFRPVSMRPRMSHVPPTPDESLPMPSTRGQLGNIEEGNTEERNGYFGAPRAQSPSLFDATASPVQEEVRRGAPLSRSTTQDSVYSQQSHRSAAHASPQTSSPEKFAQKNSFDPTGLAPPRTLFPKRSSSIMSSPLEVTDEEGTNSLSASSHSQPGRKLSSGSSAGMMSPAFPPSGSGFPLYQRSPSVCSNASELPRPSFNFSRPLSRAGTPSFDTPERQASSDSHISSFILTDDTANTPVSMTGEGFPDTLPNDPASSEATYVYSKFSLPRGKSLQRESRVLDIPLQMALQLQQAPTTAVPGPPPPSPPTRPSSSAGPRFLEDPVPRPSLERSKLSSELLRGGQEISPVMSRPSTEASRVSTNVSSRASEETPRGRPRTSPLHRDAARAYTAMSTTTSDSGSTIKAPRSVFSIAPTGNSEITPEDHVTKAIALHEQGVLNESTYHLRRAAKQGDPTGMLLYALACRHGWGMRPNQQEGVQWLRKAAESASLEIADEEDQAKEGRAVDFAERKTRKAQFALSIYELGVSHMNGWGIEQDKALALRCFEIAGCMFILLPRYLSIRGH